MHINLIEVINWKYPTLGVSISGNDWASYAAINWGEHTPISEAQIAADTLAFCKKHRGDEVRRDAEFRRNTTTVTFLGTADIEQIRTYEEKYNEAIAYLADNTAPTPIMSGECAATGEQVSDLALLVKQQYEYLKNQIRIEYGSIEGKRRKMIAEINALTTVEAVMAYVIAW